MNNDRRQTLDPCTKIVEAIDFFSQVLHPEQIAVYGYPYIHEVLEFTESMIYLRSEDQKRLELKNAIGPWVKDQSIEITTPVLQLATKIGVVLTSNFEPYLPATLIEEYQPNFLMPLIVEDELVGIILSNSWIGARHLDWTFAEAIKKLVNHAYYTGIQIEKNAQFTKQMDRKLYDQMLLHHLVTLIITELDLEQMVKNSVDGLRELTASSQTGLCLLDEDSNTISVKHYMDLKYFRKVYAETSWNKEAVPQKMSYSVENDQEALLELFGSLDIFNKLGAQYVVLLKLNPVIGFVTIGEPVGDQVYTESTFEFIESIMGTICIAIENANHLTVLKNQKKMLNSTVDSMTQLSHSIKTVSSAEDLTELSHLIFRCIHLYAGIDEAVLAKQMPDGRYQVMFSTDKIYETLCFSLSELGLEHVKKGLILDFREDSLSEYLLNLGPLLENRKTLIAPIDIIQMNDDVRGPAYMIVGLNMSRQFLNYELNYVESLASSVAPMMRQLSEKEQLLCPEKDSDEMKFLVALDRYEQEKQDYWMPYRVYYKPHNGGLFGSKDQPVSDRPIYYLGKMSCCLVCEEELFASETFEGFLEGTATEIIEALELLC